MDFYDELIWRGLVKDCTDEAGFRERLKKPVTLYCGFDPTADSLHIGHLQQLLLLKRYQLQGHHPIALVGGGTGMIGDPRPTTERKMQSETEVKANADAIGRQIDHILASDNNPVTLMNNETWLGHINILSFLRDYGKYFSVSVMLAKDTIAKRLETGISYTEFSYTILQAIDWYQLYMLRHCEVQIGGSDQWGNLVSGTDLIRKLTDNQAEVFGLTSPLITRSDGTKFGKSEGKNIWLDPNKTDAYTFYQYFVNLPDNDIETMLKRLSLQPVTQISALIDEHRQAPHLRLAQKSLAAELTKLIYGDTGLTMALRVTELLFSGAVSDLSQTEIEAAFGLKDATHVTSAMSLTEVLLACGAAPSKREARQLIQTGSISVNGSKNQDPEQMIDTDQALYGRYTIIRKGKKHYFLIEHD